jgi:hypothetical protein
MMRPDDELTPEERAALERLPRAAPPPPALEEATVAALAARGLLRRRRWLGATAALAASLMLVAGGLALSRFDSTAVAPGDARPRFALFLYEGPAYRQPAPDAVAARVQEYIEWARAERTHGSVEGGEKLRDGEAVAIVSVDSAVVSTPRPGETQLAGYFLIRAADQRSAVAIARTCPHVRYGGTMVLREIEPT